MIQRLLAISLLLLVSANLSAQPVSDFLKQQLQITPHKKQLSLLLEISLKERLSGSMDTAICYAEAAFELAESMDSLHRMGTALNSLGACYSRKGLVKLALDNYSQALEIQEKLDDQKGLQISYNGMGVLFLNNGNSDKALNFLHKGLEISKKIKDSVMVAMQLYNIGLISYSSEEYDNALAKFEEALRYGKTPKAKRTVAYIMGTQGSILSEKQFYKTALSFFERSQKLMLELNESIGISSNYQSMGKVYLQLKDYPKALQMNKEALKIREKSGYTIGMINSYNNLSTILIDMGNYSEARIYAIKAYDLSTRLQQGDSKVTAIENLFYIESQEGNCKKALNYYHQMAQLKDSLSTEKTTRNRIQIELNYDFDRKLKLRKLEQEQKDMLTAERIKNEKQLSYILVGLEFLSIAFALFFLLNSRRRRRDNLRLMRQQEEILNQKQKLEMQHHHALIQQKEINDSICYAQRIQNALFPQSTPCKTFPGAFAFLQPKNTIGGDFFWVVEIGQFKVAAVVDCTGHGVPGGFMSILGINFMNDIVVRNKILDAAQVLQEMRHRIIEALHQSELTLYSNDGMDMSLCIFDTKTNIIDFASANGKALLYKQNNEESFETLAVDRMPVCYYVRNEPFSSIKIKVDPGDILFMYTDGITDQYGGDGRQRKLGKDLLQEMLIQVLNTAPSKQEKLVSQLVNNYKGSNIQYDDMLLLSIPF
ncbi:tetratricopeptide repeat protein [Williamwhitmania taraxaci]|uniref:Serine phosphatase RsbU, regulator of sigma subunit n=1 Tax=Williamwhitmania taraxaci TaxID=1640674 RepID=A0A1G6GUN9_9BACT|nr:tetratricopeptide repeat protein [Williamwhitmania taraxaci]SDB85699.1 Serine phosphatase RsbU, regulator of sigma subunit [Williamwhitmania taraxaci]